MPRPRIIFNDDNCSLSQLPTPHSVEQVAVAVDYLRGTQVDCLCWFVAGDVAYSYPSTVIDSLYDLAAKREFGACQPDKLPLWLHRRGIDYLPLLIDHARDAGLTFYASFRMNDTHHKSNPSGVLASEFWRTHQQWRLWEVVDGFTYYNAAMDYSYPEVRQRYHDTVVEVATRYDVDGIELDFCRNPLAFQPSEAWSKRHILTRFIKRIRTTLDRIGRRRGRRLGLIVRTVFADDMLRRAGMDVRTWIRRGCMDTLVMSHLTNNLNQRVEPWLTLCRENGVLFYPSTEAGPAVLNDLRRRIRVPNPLASAHNHVVPMTPAEQVLRQRAMAQNFLAQGVDGLYMFNYPCVLHEGEENRFGTPRAFRKKVVILSEQGSLTTLAGRPKQYTFWEDLPIHVETGRPAEHGQTIRFWIRDRAVRRRGTTVRLRFRQVAERNPHASGPYEQDPIVPHGHMEMWVNGRALDTAMVRRRKQPAGKIPSGFTLRRHDLVTVALPGRRLVNGENALAFRVPRFPKERDPYVFIYELTVDVVPA